MTNSNNIAKTETALADALEKYFDDADFNRELLGTPKGVALLFKINGQRVDRDSIRLIGLTESMSLNGFEMVSFASNAREAASFEFSVSRKEFIATCMSRFEKLSK